MRAIFDTWSPYPAILDVMNLPGASLAQKESHRLYNPLGRTFTTCCVCLEREPRIFFHKITPTCTHSANVCANCIVKTIATQTQTKHWDQIDCPSAGCNLRIPHESVLYHADQESKERYDRLGVRRVLELLPEWRWCHGPGCTSGQLNVGGAEEPIMRCADCGFRQCFTHGMAWHTGRTCAQVNGEAESSHDAAEEASRILLGETTKLCPGTCGYRIEQDGGCHHMTCRICRHQYCWECSADYDPIRRGDNSRHRENCSLWRPSGQLAPTINPFGQPSRIFGQPSRVFG